MLQPVLALVALASAAAAGIWGRSARYRQKLLRRIESQSGDSDLKSLALSDFRKDVHTTLLYALVSLSAAVMAIVGTERSAVVLLLLLVPVTLSFAFGRNFVNEARLE